MTVEVKEKRYSLTVQTPGPQGVAGMNYEGVWSDGTSYQYRDAVLEGANGNVYFCTGDHTSSTSNRPSTSLTFWKLLLVGSDSYGWSNTAPHNTHTDYSGNTGYSALHYASKSKDWAVKDDGQVTNDANNADLGYSAKEWATDTDANIGSSKDWAIKSGSAQVASTDYSAKAWATHTADDIGSAKDWATKTGGQVTSTDHSAKSYASETGSNAPPDGSAKEWSITTGVVVADSEYSSKEYAQGATATGGTSKEWAQKSDGAVDTEFSAKAYASVTGTNAPPLGSAKEWAINTGGAVASSEHSAKSYANETGASAPPDGSAKEWATVTGAVIADSEYSAKEYATGTTVATGSSKEWATVTGSAVASSEFSAKEYAQGTTATGGSAKEWAQDTSAAVDTTFSAKEYAQGIQSGTGGSAKNWSQHTGSQVTGTSTNTDASAKEWAIGTSTHKSEGSSKSYATNVKHTAVSGTNYSAKHYSEIGQDWAVKANGAVRNDDDSADVEFSAKAYAVGGTGVDTGAGSSKDWATKTSGTVGNTSLYGAKYYSDNASNSATASANSATASANSATASANSATASANSATASSNSATASAGSATSASNLLANFRNDYLGDHASDTAADSHASSNSYTVSVGTLYFNTTTNNLRVCSATGSPNTYQTVNVSGGRYLQSGEGTNVIDGGATDAGGASITTDVTIGTVSTPKSLTVRGNLDVYGTTTTIHSTTLDVSDNEITLNSDVTGAPSEDAGIVINRGTSDDKTFVWDETNDKWTLGSENLVVGTVEGNLSGALLNGTTATTQSTGDNSTKIATTAYADGNFDPIGSSVAMAIALG